MCICPTQQICHRRSLIDKEADITLWFGQGQGPTDCVQGSHKVTLSLEGQRTQDEDLQHAAYARFGFGIL